MYIYVCVYIYIHIYKYIYIYIYTCIYINLQHANAAGRHTEEDQNNEQTLQT